MKNKNGISLIVLVITVIVMIILASAIIISLNNAGIINKANEAIDATNIKEVQQLASLTWSEAYLDTMNITDEEARLEEIEKVVNESVAEIDKTGKYTVTVTMSGVTVTSKDEAKWRVERTTNASGVVTEVVVTNGTDTYDVGTVVNYMPNGVGDTNYKGGWKILGADEEGRLLIMSSTSITGSKVVLGSATSIDEAKTSYINAITTLDNVVSSYKDGTIGVAVRSITVEDINKLTGYDPTTYTREFMGVSNVNTYDKEVTYEWNTAGVGYSWINGKEETGSLEVTHVNGFTYYDKTSNAFVTLPRKTSGDIATLKDTLYAYYGSERLSQTTAAYKMLFRNVTDTANVSYWLASQSVELNVYTANFSMRNVDNNLVQDKYLVYSNGPCRADEYDVRAAVTLAHNIKLTESTTIDGTYDLSK